jgi:hypothetical protein
LATLFRNIGPASMLSQPLMAAAEQLARTSERNGKRAWGYLTEANLSGENLDWAEPKVQWRDSTDAGANGK